MLKRAGQFKQAAKSLSRVAFIGAMVCGFVPAAQAVESEDELLSILGDSSKATSGAQASDVAALRAVIGQPTAEQNIFIQFFAKGEIEKALFQWQTAFDETAFAKTASGRALNALLLYRNGLQVSALESLLAIENPSEISPELLTLWKNTASEASSVWGFVQVANWQAKWTEVFGVAVEVRVLSRRVYGPEQMDVVKDLLKKTQLDTRERAWLEWQLILALSGSDDPSLAAKALAHLMKVPNNPVSQDLMTVTAARLLYQNGFLDAAIKYYEKVPKSSDYWFDAQEEMGWAHIRKGEPANAIAITKTLVTPAFKTQVGPEPVFLRALALLKVCDYPEVTKTLDLFRERFRDRAQNLLSLTEKPETPEVLALIERMKKGGVKLTDLGETAAKLPRFVTRDETLAQLVLTEKTLEAEAKLAGDLYARSLTGGTGQVGFQARFEQVRKSVETRAQAARSTIYGRVKSLAEEEVNEIGQILQKLHIVEAEVLQQISLSDRVISATKANQKNAEKKTASAGYGSDRIWFPAENETWFDELSNYRVEIKKGCGTVTQ